MTRVQPLAAILLLLGTPVCSQAAWDPSGTKAIVATVADGSRVNLGSIHFAPAADGSFSFKLSLDATAFSDHFLSMREFKCMQGRSELTCHVPYPYANPRTVTRGGYAWLEHSLLFFYKLPSDFGAKLWNGVYFEFRESGSGLTGTPKAIDLNLIAAPPANPSVPPFRPALRDDMTPNARWIKTLSIE